MAAYQLDVGELETTNCPAGGCGVAFALPAAMLARKRQDGSSFYCPNGHVMSFHDNENARLKREIEQTKKKLEWKQQEVARADERTVAARRNAERIERQRRSQKAVTTKMRKKVCAGTCPFCQEPLADLAAHVAAKHQPPAGPSTAPLAKMEKP